MKTIIKRLFVIAGIMMLVNGLAQGGRDPRYNIKRENPQSGLAKSAVQFHGILQGFNMQVWMGNMSCMGLNYDNSSNTPTGFGLEYPRGSSIEHLFGAAPWIGALVDTSSTSTPRIVKAVTTGYEGWSGPLYEFYAHPDGRDSFFVTSKNIPNGRNRVKFDDDSDGKIDEDEFDAKDNDNDGLVDEDYGALSERDMYVSYADYYNNPLITGHVPLGIRVWQRSFAWSSGVKEPILPFQYYYINEGNKILRDVYVGFFADCDVGPRYIGAYFSHNSAGYFPEVRTAYEFNSQDRPTTPIGITVLGTPRSLDSLTYTFRWYAGGDTPPTDRQRYDMMASGRIDPDEYPNISDSRFFFAFGPFNGSDELGFKPGDTLKIDVALVSGEGLTEGVNNLKENAAKALELYNRGYSAPPTPPAPPLHVQTGNDRVILEWKWRPGDVRSDPIQTWDDSNKFIPSFLPPDHWRRRNPELRNDTINSSGGSGGRTFQGFRVWRSESPNYNERTFALLAQFDIYDELGYGEGGRLEDPFIDSTMGLRGYTYIDSNLVRGRNYRYAVTSYSIPGITVVEQPLDGGGVDTIRLESPGLESGLNDNDTLIIIPFAPSTKVGDVKVVPNPYRTDVDYTYENGGFEGLGRAWDESKRVIWFIHLPAKCTIRIFSLTGDLVATIEHDDPVRQALERLDNNPRPVGQEEWNLLTESGRAIASGVYVYTVESDFGRQVGKFVVIR